MSDIKITIGGDAAGAVAALKQTQGELVRTESVASSALKGIGSSISSVGKSLITGGIFTAIAFIGVELVSAFQKSTKAAEENAKAIASAKKEYDGIVSSVVKEVSQVEVLVQAYQKENLTRKEKANIIDHLKQISPEYFSQLDSEKTSVDELAKSYDNYSNSVLRSLEIKVREAQLSKVIERRIELQDKATKFVNQEVDANGKLQKSINAIYQDDVKGKNESFNLQLLTVKEQIELNNLLLTEKKIISDIGSLQQPQDFLKKLKDVRAEIEKFKRGPVNIFGNISKIKSGEGPNTINLDLLVKPKFKFEFGDRDAFILGMMRAFLNAERIKALAEEFSRQVSDVVQTTVVDAISGVGDAIGSALAGKKDVIPNLFGNLMNSLGQQVQNLGKFLIKSAITIKIAKEAFQKLLANPIAAVAVGLGLIALGAILKTEASKKFQGFATGVRNFEGGVATVGERGPETVFLPRGASVQPNNEVSAYGGGSQVFIPAITLRGADLVIAFNRASAQLSRNN